MCRPRTNPALRARLLEQTTINSRPAVVRETPPHLARGGGRRQATGPSSLSSRIFLPSPHTPSSPPGWFKSGGLGHKLGGATGHFTPMSPLDPLLTLARALLFGVTRCFCSASFFLFCQTISELLARRWRRMMRR